MNCIKKSYFNFDDSCGPWQDRIAIILKQIIVNEEINLCPATDNKSGLQIFKAEDGSCCVYAFEKSTIYHFMCARNQGEAKLLQAVGNQILLDGMSVMDSALQRFMASHS